MDFKDALTQVYCQNPCQALPNALWKTLAKVSSANTSFQVENDQVTHLEMWQEHRLLVWWSRDRRPPNLNENFWHQVDFILFHQDYLSAAPATQFPVQRPYFRMKWQAGVYAGAMLPPGFYFQEAQIEREVSTVTDIIGQCYATIRPSEEVVLEMTRRPVFRADLCLWVMDAETRQPAGLGVAELDPAIREGSLEWIQMLPAYRRRGLATCLVDELMHRLSSLASFVTVSGEADNPSHPDALYRRCGFTGDDLWWVLTA